MQPRAARLALVRSRRVSRLVVLAQAPASGARRVHLERLRSPQGPVALRLQSAWRELARRSPPVLAARRQASPPVVVMVTAARSVRPPSAQLGSREQEEAEALHLAQATARRALGLPARWMSPQGLVRHRPMAARWTASHRRASLVLAVALPRPTRNRARHCAPGGQLQLALSPVPWSPATATPRPTAPPCRMAADRWRPPPRHAAHWNRHGAPVARPALPSMRIGSVHPMAQQARFLGPVVPVRLAPARREPALRSSPTAPPPRQFVPVLRAPSARPPPAASPAHSRLPDCSGPARWSAPCRPAAPSRAAPAASLHSPGAS